MVYDCSISPSDLLTHIGTGQCPRLVDVCMAEDVAADPWCLPGAVHVPHTEIAVWAEQNAPLAPIVVICQKGLKLSHGAAARLRAQGRDARVLEGGNHAWHAARYPRLAVANPHRSRATWVLPTSGAPQILAVAWLIRRWIDPRAELLWVPSVPGMTDAVAERFDAIAAPAAVTDLCALVALDYAPLHAFSTALDKHTAPVLPMLAALDRIHADPDAQVSAALSILDAAWTADRVGQ